MVQGKLRCLIALFAVFATLLVTRAVAVPMVTKQEFTIGQGSFGYDFVVLTDLHIAEGKKLVDGMEDFGTEGYDDADNDSMETTPPVDAVVACRDYINTELVGQPGYDVRFVLVPGDITSSSERSEWQRARKVLAGLDGRVFVVPLMGNHDVWPYVGHGLSIFPPHPGWFKEQPEEEVVVGEYYVDAFRGVYDTLRCNQPVANWEQCEWLLDPTPNTCHPWPSYYNNFAFNFQGCRFITTDFNTRKDPPPSERPGLRGEPDVYAGEAYHWTLDWLKEQLASVRPGERVICVGHHAYLAAYSNFQAGELQYIARAGLLNNKPIAASIGGHIHPFGDKYGRLLYGRDTVCDYYAHNAAKDGHVYVFHIRDSVRLQVTHSSAELASALTVQLSGDYGYEGDANAPAEFLWDFGDGSPPEIAGTSVSHQFAGLAPDTLYKVSLRVTTASGRRVWACDTVRVLAPWLGRVVNSARNPDSATPAMSVTPNPLVSGVAALHYVLPKVGPVEVRVYDVCGRTVVRKTFHAGRVGSVGLDLRGRCGVFLIKLTSEVFSATQKLVVHR